VAKGIRVDEEGDVTLEDFNSNAAADGAEQEKDNSSSKKVSCTSYIILVLMGPIHVQGLEFSFSMFFLCREKQVPRRKHRDCKILMIWIQFQLMMKEL
jgi:hypothetical protein